MKKYQVINYEKAIKKFNGIKLGQEKRDTPKSLNVSMKSWSELLSSETSEWSFDHPNTNDITMGPIMIPDIPLLSDNDESSSSEEDRDEDKGRPYEYRSRYDYGILICGQDEDFETMEEAEDLDILPIKVKQDTIIVPNCIYQFIDDMNIIYINHFHHDDYENDDYSTRYYLMNDCCEILDIEISKRESNFFCTMTFISKKTYVIDFFGDDASAFKKMRQTKRAPESYLRFFCNIFEKQIDELREISSSSIENGIHMCTLIDQYLPRTTSHMYQIYMEEIYETLTQKDREIEKLRKEVERLKTHIEYMPDGEMFLETQKHFDSCIETFK